MTAAVAEREPVRVLYVGGMPRSGSTLLTWMIGELPGHHAVGELFYLWAAGVQRDQLCGCGDTFRRCAFWTAVGERAFGGWDQVDLDRVTWLRDRVDRSTSIPRMLGPAFWTRSFRREADEYVAILQRVYAAAAAVSGQRTVVDGSKRPSLAHLLARAPGIDLALVHVVRDPRGVAHSWSRKVALPEGAGVRGHLKVRSPRLITRRWLTVNALIRSVRRTGTPVLTVRYEDLAERPADVMIEVARFAGLPDPEGAASFVRGDGAHLERAHMVEGGRVRFTPSPISIRLDEAWRTDMAAPRRRAVDLATHVARRRYGYA